MIRFLKKLSSLRNQLANIVPSRLKETQKMNGVIINFSIFVNLVRKVFVEGYKNGSRLTRHMDIDIHGGYFLIYIKSANILNSFYTHF